MTRSEAPERMSIWLIPCDEHNVLLSMYINELSEKLQSPAFEPHVTLYSGQISRNSAKQSLDYAAKHCKPVTLETKNIRTEDILTKTFYLSLKNSKDLSYLSELFKSYFFPSSFSLDPHLSLAYKILPKSARDSLVRETRLPFKKIKFSSLKAIHTPIPAKSEDDIETWQVLFSQNLR